MNQIRVRTSQRYNTKAAWEKENPVLFAGEMGIESDTLSIKVGDGQTHWNGLDYAGAGADVAAELVQFDTDFTVTEDFGRYKTNGASAVVPAAGKNLVELIRDAFSEDKQPTVTLPSLSIYSSETGLYEVGTRVEHSFTATFDPGSYSYGPVTGVKTTGIAYTNTDGTVYSPDSMTGKMPGHTVTDTSKYSITVRVSYSEGDTPKTALGNSAATGKIAAGSISATTGITTGYRKSFWGTTVEKQEMTSDTIRQLAQSSTKALARGDSFDINIPIGAEQIVVAYPSSLGECRSIVDVNGMNTNIIGSFKDQIMPVIGANNYQAIDYRVYVLERADATSVTNTYRVTI